MCAYLSQEECDELSYRMDRSVDELDACQIHLHEELLGEGSLADHEELVRAQNEVDYWMHQVDITYDAWQNGNCP